MRELLVVVDMQTDFCGRKLLGTRKLKILWKMWFLR